LHVISYASPPEKYFPGNDGSGNIHHHADVILNARFPRFLPQNGDNGNRQIAFYVIEYGSPERNLLGSGEWGINETLPALS
jgi:hypothetical protein